MARLMHRVWRVDAMALSRPPSYRLFSFHINGKLGTLRLEWKPGLTPEANAEELYQQFHSLMEHRFPGCFADGRINHVGFVDSFSNDAQDVMEDTQTFY